MTTKPLRIGTRDSVLATWQARHVAHRLKLAGYETELRYIKTEGDRVLDTPLPLMGGKGVFTKALDDALLAGEIDLAVHSLKDIPTRTPDGLTVGAVSEREDTSDVLVTRGRIDDITRAQSGSAGHASAGDHGRPAFLDDPKYEAVIASSSNRRIGQWLARYPRHRMTDIRGNIQTRLEKLQNSHWDGAIFAAAGLRRLRLDKYIDQKLKWMLPAPAQGAMGVMVREDDWPVREAVKVVHNARSALCTTIERDILHTLEGGCSAPVGALARLIDDVVYLHVNIVRPNGTGMITLEMSESHEDARHLGKIAAEEALKLGADTLIRELSASSGSSDASDATNDTDDNQPSGSSADHKKSP